MKVNFLILLSILFLNACRVQPDAENGPIEIDIREQADMTAFFKTYRSVALETTKDNLIGKIGKIQTDSNNIYLLDTKQQEVIIFDLQGKYQGKISKQGRASGEYLSMVDFNVYRAVIYCLSRPDRKIYGYSREGELLEVHTLDDYYNNFTVVDDSLMWLYSEYSGRKGYNFTLFDYRTDRIKEKRDSFEKAQDYDFQGSPFHWSKEGLLITEQFDPTIYRMTEEGKVPFLVFDFHLLNKFPHDYKTKDWSELMRQYQNKEMFHRIGHVSLSKNILTVVYTAFYDGMGIRENIAKVDLDSGKVKVVRFGDKIDPEFPFIFNPSGFCRNELVFWAPVMLVKDFMKRFNINLPDGDKIGEEDNPVLFFHRLMEEDV